MTLAQTVSYLINVMVFGDANAVIRNRRRLIRLLIFKLQKFHSSCSWFPGLWEEKIGLDAM